MSSLAPNPNSKYIAFFSEIDYLVMSVMSIHFIFRIITINLNCKNHQIVYKKSTTQPKYFEREYAVKQNQCYAVVASEPGLRVGSEKIEIIVMRC